MMAQILKLREFKMLVCYDLRYVSHIRQSERRLAAETIAQFSVMFVVQIPTAGDGVVVIRRLQRWRRVV